MTTNSNNIFRNNKDFYPTPIEVIERMMMGEDFYGKTILEPSAGKGNIVDWLKTNGAGRVVACENDPTLLKLLRGKCELVAEDFLTVTSDQVSHVDYIVMNPPYSEGPKHILHAFEVAPAGCTIIALCNSDNLDRGYRYERNQQLIETIELNGNSEYLGNVFSHAERATDVKVELIKLYKPGTGEDEWKGYMFSDHDEDMLNANETEGLVQYNTVRELVNRYISAVKMFDEVMEATKRINDIACFTDYKAVTGRNGEKRQEKQHYGEPPIQFQAVQTRDNRSTTVTREEYKKQLQRYYWRIIFQKLKMDKYETQSLRDQMNRFIENQVNVPFTMKNIYRVIDMIIQTHGQRMHNALVEAFEHICEFSAENSTAGEKWKTNANYMVNRKFIVPNMCDGYYYGTANEYVEVSGYYTNKITDVCKALCYLTGLDYEKIGSLSERVGTRWDSNHIDWGEWFFWGFFRCKGFKKGTMHFEFLDEDVWFKFNYEVAKTKGWNLPKRGEGWQQSPSKLIPSIKEGQRYRCKKSVKVDGETWYRKGNIYYCEEEHNYMYGFITREDGQKHPWPIYIEKKRGTDDWRDWFEEVA